MKTLLLTLGAIVAVVGLVAGITFLANRTGEDGPETPAPKAPDMAVGLRFPETAVETGVEYPLHAPGHYDFWFANPHDRPFELGLSDKNCDCAGVEAAVLTPEAFASPEEWTQLRAELPTTGALLVALAPQGPLTLTGPAVAGMARAHQFLGDRLCWQQLEVTRRFSVPPHATGLVRIRWHANQNEPTPMKTLSVTLWTRDALNPEAAAGPRLSVPMALVLPVRLDPPSRTVAVPELAPDESTKVDVVCWSSTHHQFDLEPYTDSDFLTVRSRPLLPGEAEKLAARYNTQVLSGYVVTATVHGRLSETRQLDLGPFNYHVYFKGGIAGVEVLPVTVTGMVHGDVTVTAPPDQRDRISLGLFRSDEGKSVPVSIVADRPGVTVKLVGLEPEELKRYLKAELQPKGTSGSKPAWELTLRVPPHALQGKLPDQSAIILQTQGSSSRHIRIPVTGHAYLGGR
jgi:hypothetical protein